MAVEEGAHVGISTAELFKYKGNGHTNFFITRTSNGDCVKDVRDGWIKVVNLLTEDSGYVPFAYVEYAE